MTRIGYAVWLVRRGWALWRARRAIDAYVHHREELARIGVHDPAKVIGGGAR